MLMTVPWAGSLRRTGSARRPPRRPPGEQLGHSGIQITSDI
jgi:hypothetical protein